MSNDAGRVVNNCAGCWEVDTLRKQVNTAILIKSRHEKDMEKAVAGLTARGQLLQLACTRYRGELADNATKLHSQEVEIESLREQLSRAKENNFRDGRNWEHFEGVYYE